MDNTVQHPAPEHCGLKPEIHTIPSKRIPRKSIINKLNHLNFSSQPVVVVFSTSDLAAHIEYEGYVLPCTGKEVLIKISSKPKPEDFFRYRLEYIRFSTTTGHYRFTPLYFGITEDGINIELPSFGEQYNPTSSPYIKARNCKALISQHAVEIMAEVQSYSAISFVCIFDTEFKDSRLINADLPVHVQITNADQTVFSGSCSITWYERLQGIFHLSPQTGSLQRFQTREYRSARLILDNLPLISFIHPLSGSHMEFTILDISGTGFSITNQTAMLFPGLRIHETHISFPDGTKLTCDIQVIHRKEDDDQRAGMAILDIQPIDHLKLLSILHTARDPNAFLCKKVNLNRLMEFFFDSGFIYPQKYLYLQPYRETLMAIYDKLYNHENNIARHFIYQKGDLILGHLAMMRFFEKSWLIHHHASIPEGGINAGIHVLNQATSFITDSYRYHMMHLNYILCFFRPENRFPKRVFGDLAAKVDNRKLCSIDDFAYVHIRDMDMQNRSENIWELKQPDSYELHVLADHYERISGGLLLEAMDILPHHNNNRGLLASFEEIGISRKMEFRVLSCEGQIAAFFFLNASDPGLNMSDLTNSLMVIVINSSLLKKDILQEYAEAFLSETQSSSCPLLLYPVSAVEELNITYEKVYELWIIQSNLSDVYHDHISQLFRGSLKNLSSQKVAK